MNKKEKRSGNRIKAMVNCGGLVTDREWPIYLFGLARDETDDWFIRKVFGHDLNAITLDMLNAVTHKLSAWWREELKETGKMPRALTITECNKVVADGGFVVIITDSEIRKFLKKNYRKEFIYKHMKRIGNISLEGRAPVAWKRDQEDLKNRFRWTVCEITGGFADVACLNDDEDRLKKLPAREKGRWRDTKENVYMVEFIGSWGQSFAVRILNQRVKMLPERFYKYLSPTAKMLCRVVTGTNYSPIILTLDQISKILGWKPETTNRTLRTTLITRGFESLVKYYFINSFKTEGENKPSQWVIWKRKDWFYEPEPAKLSDKKHSESDKKHNKSDKKHNN